MGAARTASSGPNVRSSTAIWSALARSVRITSRSKSSRVGVSFIEWPLGCQLLDRVPHRVDRGVAGRRWSSDDREQAVLVVSPSSPPQALVHDGASQVAAWVIDRLPALVDAEEGVVHHFLRNRTRPDQQPGQPDHASVRRPVERVERRAVVGGQEGILSVQRHVFRSERGHTRLSHGSRRTFPRDRSTPISRRRCPEPPAPPGPPAAGRRG